MGNHVLGLFAKWPEAGRVKTRLAAEIGTIRATAIARAMLLDSLRVFTIPGATQILCFAPSEQRRQFQSLPLQSWILEEQSAGNLGDRLQYFFQNHAGYPTVVIGSDSPSMPVEFIQQAFEQLRTRDVVVGPARDGGFYLLGMKDFPQTLLDGIQWSTEQVCQQLFINIQRLELSNALLPEWFDIDTSKDLEALSDHPKLDHIRQVLRTNPNQDSADCSSS